MKLKNFFTILPLVVATSTAFAENIANTEKDKASTFHFSAQVNRTIEQDLMHANVYSRKNGKSLADLKKAVSLNLNQVLAEAKKYPSIEVQAEGISNSVNYDDKGKVNGWLATGSISLKSKDFEAMAAVLDNLGKDVAIRHVYFSVSPEKIASLEDEMTLEIIQKFQHKADLIQKALGAKTYKLSNMSINTPNDGDYGRSRYFDSAYRAAPIMAAESQSKMEEMPLEAGKTTISASASGYIEFE